jgi:endonuclease-3 related protein
VKLALSAEDQLRAWYGALLQVWGSQHWWPARSRFEVIVGAYLTQNTSWNNVEKALANLRRATALNPAKITAIPLAELEQLVRPAGYFRQKAARLKQFAAFLEQRYSGSLTRMFAQSTERLRAELLALNGIGPETADAILLYAGGHSVFVVDAYARRILLRHRVIDHSPGYEEIRAIFERALSTAMPAEVTSAASDTEHKPTRMSRTSRSVAGRNFNEMHGLLVTAGKLHCFKSFPKCDGCPLQPFLPPSGPTLDVVL